MIFEIFIKYAQVQGIRNLSSKYFYHSLCHSPYTNGTQIQSSEKYAVFMHISGFYSYFKEKLQPNQNWYYNYSSNMRRFKVYGFYIQKFTIIASAIRPTQMEHKFKVVKNTPFLCIFRDLYSFFKEKLQPNQKWYYKYSSNMRRFKV